MDANKSMLFLIKHGHVFHVNTCSQSFRNWWQPLFLCFICIKLGNKYCIHLSLGLGGGRILAAFVMICISHGLLWQTKMNGLKKNSWISPQDTNFHNQTSRAKCIRKGNVIKHAGQFMSVSKEEPHLESLEVVQYFCIQLYLSTVQKAWATLYFFIFC